MKKRVFIGVVLALCGVTMHAQNVTTKNKSRCSCSFSSINQVGLVVGEKNESYSLQTVNGFRYKTWLVGAGVGIDGYRYRSVPVFLQLRKEFPTNGNAVFLYNDIGTNYPWVKDNQKVFYSSGDFHQGLYYDGGIGYKVSMKRQALVLSSGFSLKKLSERYSGITCAFIGGPCQPAIDNYYYSLKRVSFKLGLQF